MATSDLLRPCPVCGGTRGEILHSQAFAGADGVDDHVDFVSCITCGMVFSDIAAVQADFDEMYEADSIHADLRVYENEATDPVVAAQERAPVDAPFNVDRLRTAVRILVDHFPDRSLRILDAGCATGTFLGLMQEAGYENIVGLEPSRAAVATARRIYGIDAVVGSFTSPPSGLGTFDLVTLHHVLEHIYDVGAAVAALRALLAEGAHVYIEVPDAERYVDHLVSPYDDFNTEHINHFSIGTLRRLMESSGFDFVAADPLVHQIAGFSRPAVYGIWRRGPGAKLPDGRDDALVDGVRSFVRRSDDLVLQIDSHLRGEIRADDPVVIWGAGQLARKLLADTVLRDARVEAIVDGNPQRQGRRLDGVQIVGPTEVAGFDAPIVVASIYHEQSILQDIGASGLPNRVIRLLQPA